MWIPDQPEVNRTFAVLFAERWGVDAATIQHIGDFGNSVYGCQLDGRSVILRLTDPKDRSQPINQAELDFLAHLGRCGVQVSLPIPSRRGSLIEAGSVDDETLLASMFEYAPGVQVTPESPYWHEAFFREWGRTLAHIHQAARAYEPPSDARRWQWMDEDLIANARRYIPASDSASLRELDTVMEHISRLPTNRDSYGLTHADFSYRNFHYDPHSGITAFDFGNCCYHWFISDIAIALSTLRHYPSSERDQYRAWLLAGYRDVFPIDPFLFTQLNWFIRLRILYVYLDRLALFGTSPADDQRKTLETLRQRVHECFVW